MKCLAFAFSQRRGQPKRRRVITSKCSSSSSFLQQNSLRSLPLNCKRYVAQDVWRGLPFHCTVNWDLTLSIQRYDRALDSIHIQKVLDGISRIERTFASDGSPNDSICPYAGGCGGPVAVHFVFILGSLDVLSREQSWPILHTIQELMLTNPPPMETRSR